jgi:uncharacterized damage-inducible protein DinB
MRVPNTAVRDHLVKVLEWEDAHVSLDRAVADLPAAARGERPAGFEHSVWQLLEHIRIAQKDILDFCLNPKYSHDLKWPDDYWPRSPEPPGEEAWDESLAECRRTTERLQRMAREVEDLTETVPTGEGSQTYLRGLLLAADHVAYHVGQIVQVRKALGAWPARS